jgi:hypothetical protein
LACRHFHGVGIKDPMVLKTDTLETEILDKSISFDQKGASMYLLQLSRHVNIKWPTLAPPYIPDAVAPASNPGFVQVKGYTLPELAKKIRGWAMAYNSVGIGFVQESGRRSNGPLNLQVT